MMTNLGESGHEIVARLKRDLLPTFKSGLMFWPICDFFTFKFIPVHLQVCLDHLSLSLSLSLHGLDGGMIRPHFRSPNQGKLFQFS
jgi:hypothetical protein